MLLLVLFSFTSLTSTFSFSSEGKYVVVIGVDGLGSSNLKDLRLRGKTPNIDFIKSKSAWTYHAKIDRVAMSGQNWAAMLTGSGSKVHGVNSNQCIRGNKLPTIFDVLKGQSLKTALVHEWTPIVCYSKQSSIDIHHLVKGTDVVAEKAISVLEKDNPNFLFIAFDEVDSTSHKHGGISREFIQSIQNVDRAVGSIIQSLKRMGRLDKTLLIFTADHGSSRLYRGHSTKLARVPFFVSGPKVKKGKMKIRLFGKRVIRNGLVAPLVSQFFGVPSPKVWEYSAKPLSRYLDF